MPKCSYAAARKFSAARGANQQLAPQQERLDLVDQRVGREVHRVGHRLDAHRTADKDAANRFEILPILRIEPQRVDALHRQGVAGDGKRDLPVGPALGVIADPAEPIVRQPGRAAAAAGDFRRRVVDDLHPQLLRVAADDLRQLLDRVEVQVLPDYEAVAQRRREQTAAGGGPDERERAERHVDDPRVHPLAERQVDAKILHRRIQETPRPPSAGDGFHR